MKSTDERLRLNRILAEAMVEHQKKFDALKEFDDAIIRTGSISNIEETIQNRAELEKAERLAYEREKEAMRNYLEYVGAERKSKGIS
jgi:hypothetical protein